MTNKKWALLLFFGPFLAEYSAPIILIPYPSSFRAVVDWAKYREVPRTDVII